MRSKAVLIYPQILRGAFLFGGSGGTGALVARDEKSNTWGGPAFYTIGQFSFGFQAGADAAEVVLVALTNRGLSAFLSTSSKLGADAAVTAGPIGGGAEAATANLSVDILSFSRTKGLYRRGLGQRRGGGGAGVVESGLLQQGRQPLGNPHLAGRVEPARRRFDRGRGEGRQREVIHREVAPSAAPAYPAGTGPAGR